MWKSAFTAITSFRLLILDINGSDNYTKYFCIKSLFFLGFYQGHLQQNQMEFGLKKWEKYWSVTHTNQSWCNAGLVLNCLTWLSKNSRSQRKVGPRPQHAQRSQNSRLSTPMGRMMSQMKKRTMSTMMCNHHHGPLEPSHTVAVLGVCHGCPKDRKMWQFGLLRIQHGLKPLWHAPFSTIFK